MISNDNWVQTEPWAEYFTRPASLNYRAQVRGTEGRHHRLEWSNRFIIRQASTPRVAKIQTLPEEAAAITRRWWQSFQGEVGSHPRTRWCCRRFAINHHPPGMHDSPLARHLMWTGWEWAVRQSNALRLQEETALMLLNWELTVVGKRVLNSTPWGSPGGPVVKTPYLHGCGSRFDPQAVRCSQ